MPTLKMIKIFVWLLLVSLIVSGCSVTFQTSGSDGSATDGGVFKTANSGMSWQQKALIAGVSSQILTFNQANIYALALDPQDKNALYAGTVDGGLLYSYDGGTSWNVAKTLGQRAVNEVSVSPQDKCTVYAASENKIYQTTDCSRTWQELYFDNDPSLRIYSIALDSKNEKIIYAGTSRGEIIMSQDGGQSWAALKRFEDSKKTSDNAVVRVAVGNPNTAVIWAATAGSGIYKSSDRGKTWQNFAEVLQAIDSKNALRLAEASFSPDGQIAIAATKAGLIRTTDGGAHWQPIELVPPADKTIINTVIMYPADSQRIYYATDTSFGWTKDGGQTWTSKKLPSSRSGKALAVDPANPDIVYLGVFFIKKP